MHVDFISFDVVCRLDKLVGVHDSPALKVISDIVVYPFGTMDFAEDLDQELASRIVRRTATLGDAMEVLEALRRWLVGRRHVRQWASFTARLMLRQL